MNIHKNRLAELRKAMKEKGVDGFIIPSNDEFMNEYVPDHARRLEWLTGFSGSAGMAFVLEKKAAFFTDGRYMLQAAEQLPKGEYEIFNTSDVKPGAWLKENLNASKVLGLNPMLFSNNAVVKYQEAAKVKPCADLIDIIWKDKPQKPASEIKAHPLKYTGKNTAAKLKEITAHIKEHMADMQLITAPDSICWLLNIRASDVPNTPLVLARLLVDASGEGVLFVDLNLPLPEGEGRGEGGALTKKNNIAKLKENNSPLSLTLSIRERGLARHLGSNIKIQPLSALDKYLQKLSGKKILLDKVQAPYMFYDVLSKNNVVIDKADPCILPKACKNKVEVEGAIDAHVRDGIAVTSFLCWLKENYKKTKVTEISLAEKLLEFRKLDKNFIEPSFDTIAGFASNGAIVHYHASEKSSKEIKGNSLLLLDSGGQYLSGTTDITRTIAIGKPTLEQKRNFTLVLKGHIAIATSVFPKGTSGHQLDALARQPLWKHGLDYDHGTGHGVGSFLGVHEGPQRISKAPNEVALLPGMIISNEPGYYKNGEYGIRIESLVVVQSCDVIARNRPLGSMTRQSSVSSKESWIASSPSLRSTHRNDVAPNGTHEKQFLRFRTLTCVPIDPQLVDFSILDISEKQWLIDYHMWVYKTLSENSKKNSDFVSLDKKNILWLKEILADYKTAVPL